MAASVSLRRTEATPAPSSRLATPTVALREPVVAGMPTGATQQIRVLMARFGPGDRTVFHRHRSPVTGPPVKAA